MKKLVSRVEPALIRRADHIFVTAQKFKEDIAAMGRRPVLLPQRRGPPEFERAPSPGAQSGGRIFGYVGMIGHWFDTEAVTAILDADPRNRVVSGGAQRNISPRARAATWTGRVPKEEVASRIASFDVCLYPFRKTPFLDAVDPVKIYEYLAMNKPVLAVRSRETEKFGSLLTTYSSVEELKRLSAGKFAPPFDDGARRAFILTTAGTSG
jgi:glycosyltransferase involved in cell wall biosynthesis